MTRSGSATWSLVGPTGWHGLLPALPGLDYPVTRWPCRGRDVRRLAVRRSGRRGGSSRPRPGHRTGRRAPAPTGVRLASGAELSADDVIVGADGSASRVAADAGLVDDRTSAVGVRAAPLHPGASGAAAHPAVGTRAMAAVPRLRMDLPHRLTAARTSGSGWRSGPTARSPGRPERGSTRSWSTWSGWVCCPEFDGPGRERLGGWLKMGASARIPAGRNVLLVGDAAGTDQSAAGRRNRPGDGQRHAAARRFSTAARGTRPIAIAGPCMRRPASAAQRAGAGGHRARIRARSRSPGAC